MSATLTETVTLDRRAVMDLLVEAEAVAEVFEILSGVCPTKLTDRLTHLSERVAEGVLGDTQDGPKGEIIGPRVDLWDAAKSRAHELLGRSPEGDDAR